ncbi:unnamed protein product [Lactuca saligna]|uniref:Uncharacterized protein n=1 Tax=Lactuca saligna TaxID=75948 RepID=A0AA36E423_LACSI|nr:unnamed protein product [Lactuca saligna]
MEFSEERQVVMQVELERLLLICERIIRHEKLKVMIKIWVNGFEGQKLEGQSATFSTKIAETSNGGAKQSVVVRNPSNCCSNLFSQVAAKILQDEAHGKNYKSYQVRDELGIKDNEKAMVLNFGGQEEIYVARTPRRLDVVGGIVHYSGSLVLQILGGTKHPNNRQTRGSSLPWSTELGNHKQAWYCLDRAIRADPEDVSLRHPRASIYVEPGNYHKAAESCEQI